MQIPEYNERIVANVTPRTKMNIQEPAIMRDRSYLGNEVRTISNTVNTLGDAFVQMKQQRDAGIVDEFMNNFNIDSANKIRELQDKYKGANANKVVGLYQEWRDNYFSEHQSKNDKDEAQLYLENQEQIDGAKKNLDRSYPATINTLSNYAARELETYRNNQLQERVYTLQESIANDDNLENIAIYANNLSGVLGERFKGTGKNVGRLTKDALESALSTNVMRSIQNDPKAALVKLSTKNFTDNLKPEQAMKLKTQAIKGFIDKESQNYAEATLNGGLYSFDWQGAEQFLGDDLKATQFAITSEGMKKRNNLKKIQSEQEKAIVDEVLPQLKNAINAKDQERIDGLMQMCIMGGEPCMKQAQAMISSKEFINHYDQLKADMYSEPTEEELQLVRLQRKAREVTPRDIVQSRGGITSQDLLDEATATLMPNSAQYLIERNNIPMAEGVTNQDRREVYEMRQAQLNEIDAQIGEQSARVAEIEDQIAGGKSMDLGTLLNGLHPVNQAMVIDSYIDQRNFDSLSNQMSADGLKLDKLVENAYKSAYNTTPQVSGTIYRNYRNLIKDALINYKMSTGKAPSESEFYAIAGTVNASVLSEDSNENAIIALAQRNSGKFLQGEKSTFTSPRDQYNALIEDIGNNDRFKNLSDLQKKTLANYIVAGNMNAAITFLKGIRK